MNRVEIKNWSKEKLKGNNWKILGIILLANIIGSALANIPVIGFVLITIIEIGLIQYITNFINDKEHNIEQLFSKFSNWKQITLTAILEFIFVFLWTLLLIIPGIIKAYQYSLVNFILMDENNLGAKEVLELSGKMMKGYKWELFTLELSFIGWHILAIFTLGILELWIIPYQQVVTTKFLLQVKENYEKANA